ncbi:MAG: hypothetical protein ABI589_06665 [Burkholderiales bacterium]
MPEDQPLGLTVHSMPTVRQTAEAEQRRTKIGRFKMLAVLLVCAAPVVASYFTYYVVRPDARRNFGELIDPQRPLPDVIANPATGGDPVNLRSLRGQWLLISVAGGDCGSICERHLYLQRQLREGLGREKDRLDWVWLVDDSQPVQGALTPALKDSTVLRVPHDSLAKWLNPAPGQALVDHLYLVDPLGNWMMRFPAGLDTAGALKAKRDLERVLRASASWDTAGREK